MTSDETGRRGSYVDGYPDPVSSSYSLILLELTRLPVVAGYRAVLPIVFSLWGTGMTSRAPDAAGRMTPTDYLMQSPIGMLLFHSFGMAHLGQLCRVQLPGVVAAILFLQVLASVLWLRGFQLDPLEWLWRSLTHWARKPLLRRPQPGG